MSFMSRKKQYGSLPTRKPNKHRTHLSLVQPLKYPEDVHDEAIPREAREELKGRIRAAHQAACVASLNRWREQEEAMRRAIIEQQRALEEEEDGTE